MIRLTDTSITLARHPFPSDLPEYNGEQTFTFDVHADVYSESRTGILTDGHKHTVYTNMTTSDLRRLRDEINTVLGE